MNWNFHEIDKNIFVFLNRDHSDLMDGVMFSIRNLLFWVPLILLCVFVVIDYKRNKTMPHRSVKVLMLCTLMLVQIVLCEYILPYLMDPMAVMDRPAYNSDITTSIDLASFNFATRAVIFSSQACAVAAISVFLIIFSDTQKWLKAILIFWVVILSYNRIYIGAQYPSTILVSLTLGAGIGLLAYRYYEYLRSSFFAI